MPTQTVTRSVADSAVAAALSDSSSEEDFDMNDEDDFDQLDDGR